MALSDSDVQKQIKHMMAFIDQEANEKADEIDTRAEEEFNIEKGRLVEEQRRKIMDYYTRKEKQVELHRKIQSSNMLNQARLRVLKAGEDYISQVLDEAKARLGEVTKDTARYKVLLNTLTLQAMFRLLEPEVAISCRAQDANLLDIAELQNQYKLITKADVKLTMGANLPANASGGVEVVARRGKIRVVNTLDSRLEMISRQLLPQIRVALFGWNPNRKFLD
ncbi:V-type proton ATPase subunit E-like [Ornithodoros turicata]|uniref:V-type proton ATPase subunit E-like n=1 Tax=Ornithodoros turicata TaxID=34597 RepID=UPI003139AE64